MKLCKTSASKLTEHSWHHKIQWENIIILGRESKMKYRKIKEGSLIAINANCISQASNEVSSILFENVKKYVEDNLCQLHSWFGSGVGWTMNVVCVFSVFFFLYNIVEGECGEWLPCRWSIHTE